MDYCKLTLEVGHSGDEQFKLFVSEDRDEVPWDQLVEALQEGVHLLLDVLVEMEVRLPLDIVLLVVVGHVDVSPAWHQVHDLRAPEVVIGDRERLVEAVHVALRLQAPVEAHVEVVVEVFQILEAELLADKHLVDALHEVAFEMAAFKERFCDGTADESEVAEMIALYA